MRRTSAILLLLVAVGSRLMAGGSGEQGSATAGAPPAAAEQGVRAEQAGNSGQPQAGVATATGVPAAGRVQTVENRYYSTAVATAPTEEEARRLAQAAAIDGVFRHLQKDAFFRDIFITRWPTTIETLESAITDRTLSGITAQVTVAVPLTAVELTEREYAPQAEQLLDQASALLAAARAKHQEAAGLEANLQSAEAALLYTQSRRDLEQAQVAIQPLGVSSVMSSGGEGVAVLRQSITAELRTAATGLSRLQAVQAQAVQDERQRQIQQTLTTYAGESREITGFMLDASTRSPFYDLPLETLNRELLALQTKRERAELLIRQMNEIKQSLPRTDVFLIQSIEATVSDLTQATRALRTYESEVRAEIALPRIERQRNARAAAEFWVAVGDGLIWGLVHEPYHYVSLRVDLPFVLSPRTEPMVLEHFDGTLAAQAAFDIPIWLRTQLTAKGVGIAGTDHRSTAQTVDIGYHNGLLLGLGFGWDWQTQYRNGAATEYADADLTNRLFVHLGYVEPGEPNPMFLTTLSYQVPILDLPLSLAYHFNIGLGAWVNIGGILTVEGGFQFSALQTAAVDPQAGNYDAFTLESVWHLGVGVHLPPPFTIGVEFRSEGYQAIAADGRTAGSLDERLGWRFYLGYSF